MTPTTITYAVTTLRSGEQAENYAPHVWEYRVKVEKDGKPYLPYATEGIKKLGYPGDAIAAMQRDWAKRIVRGLCCNFREAGDNDGRTGMDAHFYPTLEKLEIDHERGEIHVVIEQPYTD